MKENKTTPYKINTLVTNNYVVNIWARPWKYQGSREVYAATITFPTGYLKGKTMWSSALASTVQRAMEIAYEGGQGERTVPDGQAPAPGVPALA